ncbi:MAG TPA: DUF2157 domain-containing protein [Thermoanaerobaculia bacterium]|nr:DUF2157 domain-containing protein [Thermoanaerobaculia bacterium]
MRPDVARAIPELVERGLLSPEQAEPLLSEARGELVSVARGLSWLLYLGVALLAGGVGLLVKQNLDRIGPVTIAVAIALAAALPLAWVFRRAPAFSWGVVESPHFAFEYLLLLGVLLAAADLAYVEVKFAALGESWPWHLLIVALCSGLAAFRFDSRVVFSLALSSFAAWRGVSVANLGADVVTSSAASVRWNALGCGVLFVLLGHLLRRLDRKAHFEPAALYLGWLLALAAMASGMFELGGAGLLWSFVLLLVGVGLAIWAFRGRRFPLFAFGVVAAYAALSRLAMEAIGIEVLGCLWFASTSLALIFGLVFAQRRMKEAA